MNMLESRPSAKKVALIGGLLALAAAAGAWSEVVALQVEEGIPFRGRSLAAHWTGFADGIQSEAQVWAAEGVTGTNRPEPTTMAFAAATKWTPANGVVHVWASGDVAPDTVSLDRRLAFGRLEVQLPGSVKTWSEGEDWSNERPVNVSVIVDMLASGAPTHEDSLRRIHDPATGLQSDWHTRGTLVQATGSGAIFVDGVAFMPSDTAANWGELRNTRQGSVHMNKVAPGR